MILRLIFTISLLNLSINLFAQNDTLSGLLFHEQYESTLNLSPDEPFTFNNQFEVSFDLSLDTKAYYGNIIFLWESEDFNLHLSHINYKNSDSSYISLFLNQAKTSVNISVPKTEITLDNWSKVKLTLDKTENLIILYYDGIEKTLDVEIPDNITLIFGGIPPWEYYFGVDASLFAIKDVKINLDGELSHHFKLDEIKDNYAYDELGYRRGIQESCEWLRSRHIKWKEIARFETDLMPGVAYNENDHLLYIVNKKDLIKYNFEDNITERIKYQKERPRTANTAIFNPVTRELLSYYWGKGEVSKYDEKNNIWSDIDMSKDTLQHYYANTSFIDNKGDLYMFGGYGWYENKNHLQKYDSKTKEWNLIETYGDSIYPRANSLICPTNKPDEYFVYGGNGNKSGKQEYGFNSIKDLYILDLGKSSFKKIWDSNSNKLGLISTERGGNLVFDKNNNNLYALMHNDPNTANQNAKSTLCAISIDSSTITDLSYPISKERNLWNIHFYYDSTLSKFLISANKYKIQYTPSADTVIFYSLEYPPLNSEFLESIQSEKELRYNHYASSNLFSKWYMFPGYFLFAYILFVYLKKKFEKENTNLDSVTIIDEEEKKKNAIHLTGEFQAIDFNGKDITSLFSPKIQELFLLILIYHFIVNNRKYHRITSEFINSVLWPDFSTNEAKNVRGVTTHKLRELLVSFDKVELIYDDKSWLISISENVYLDVQEYLELEKTYRDANFNVNIVNSFLSIIRNGGFLTNISYSWLDPIKQDINQNIINYGIKLIDYSNSANLYEQVVALSDKILTIDPVYETVLVAKISALNKLGKLGYIKETYNKFCKEYKDLYAEEYNLSMEELLDRKK